MTEKIGEKKNTLREAKVILENERLVTEDLPKRMFRVQLEKDIIIFFNYIWGKFGSYTSLIKPNETPTAGAITSPFSHVG